MRVIISEEWLDGQALQLLTYLRKKTGEYKKAVDILIRVFDKFYQQTEKVSFLSLSSARLWLKIVADKELKLNNNAIQKSAAN